MWMEKLYFYLLLIMITNYVIFIVFLILSFLDMIDVFLFYFLVVDEIEIVLFRMLILFIIVSRL